MVLNLPFFGGVLFVKLISYHERCSAFKFDIPCLKLKFLCCSGQLVYVRNVYFLKARIYCFSLYRIIMMINIYDI